MSDPRSILHNPVSRRGFLSAASALGLSIPILSACSSSKSSAPAGAVAGSASSASAAATKLAFQLSWLPTSEFAGAFIAANKGYFTANKLDVTLLNGGPNVTPETTVVSGKALVASSNADSVAAARKNGAKLKVIGSAFQKNPFCVMSKAATPITSPQDMIGKKIGVASANATAFNLLLKINNIDASKIKVVPVQFDPTPVANGEVDGQVVFVINEPTQLAIKGVETHTFLFADYGYQVFADVLFATEDTISKQPDVLAAFIRSLRQGWSDNLTDPNLGADLAVNTYGKGQGFNLKQQQLESAAIKQIMITSTVPQPIALPADLIAANIKTLNLAGFTTTAADLFDTSVLAKV